VVAEPLTGAERAARYRQRKAGKLVTPPPRSVEAANTRHAMAVFKKATQYRIAADKLLQIMKSPGNSLPLRDPTYHLYHHATELVLKACLLSHDLHNTGRHNIGELYERCRSNKVLDLSNDGVIGLLEKGNNGDRYRYVMPNNVFTPELSWVHEVVGQLFEAVEPQVIAWATNNSALPEPSTIWHSLGKPVVIGKQPVPSKPGP
jgi:hypothetical protein